MSIVVFTALLVVIVAALLYGAIIFNSLVSLKNNVKKAWANIEVLLKQRYDELPNLIETVKGYARYERETLESLTKARTALLEAKTMSQRSEASGRISSVLKTIFAVAENYPTLKASENFIKLQKRISSLENEIADRREFYNESVNNYNTRLQSFPDLIFAGLFGFDESEPFMAHPNEKQMPSANLNGL